MAIKKLLDIVLTSLDNGKATDVDIFDVKKITSVSDYILIASGNSRRQVNALADKLIQNVKENKFETLGVEGKAEGEWVLVDLGDIIVHIMHPSSREYYQLEKLWGNNP
jgi:ribosome-associated protein